LNFEGNRCVAEILKSHHLESSTEGSTLQDGFRSLSPDLLTGIAKSFYLLDKCLPDLLHQGSYLEFGLYRGFSLWFAQQVGSRFVQSDFNYFGFDSFAGLPPKSQDYIGGPWAPGVYAVGLEEVTQHLLHHGTDFSRLHLIPGWFSQELFKNWSMQFSQVKPSIITIDSDVYEACRDILHFFADYLRPGNIILFDDFINQYDSPSINKYGERKALMEFLSQRPDIKLAHLFPFGWHGYVFMVTSCNGMSLDNAAKEKVTALIGKTELPDHPVFAPAGF